MKLETPSYRYHNSTKAIAQHGLASEMNNFPSADIF